MLRWSCSGGTAVVVAEGSDEGQRRGNPDGWSSAGVYAARTVDRRTAGLVVKWSDYGSQTESEVEGSLLSILEDYSAHCCKSNTI